MSLLLALPRRYKVLRRLGAGAMGAVYLARDQDLDRSVAIKVLRDLPEHLGARERFQREAQVLAKHPHPALVTLYDLDVEAAVPYLVLEWMGGGDLEGRRRRQGPMPGAEVARLGAHLASGLAHLHELGILHRDLKPANVLFDEEGRGALADLGLAKDAGGKDLTETGSIVGTPRYMAPEVLLHATYSPASDLYGLAATLVEAWVENPPAKVFGERDAYARLLRSLPSTPLRATLLRCLREQPSSRPADAHELRERLLEVAGAGAAAPAPSGPLEGATLELPPVASGSSASAPAAAPGRRGPPVAAIALGVLAGIGVLVPGLEPGRGPPSPGPPPPGPATAGEAPARRLAEARDAVQEAAARLASGNTLREKPRDPARLPDLAEDFLDPAEELRWRRYLRALRVWAEAALEAPPRDPAQARRAFDEVLDRALKVHNRLRQIQTILEEPGFFALLPPEELSRYGELRTRTDKARTTVGQQVHRELAFRPGEVPLMLAHHALYGPVYRRGMAGRADDLLGLLREDQASPWAGVAVETLVWELRANDVLSKMGFGEMTCPEHRRRLLQLVPPGGVAAPALPAGDKAWGKLVFATESHTTRCGEDADLAGARAAFQALAAPGG